MVCVAALSSTTRSAAIWSLRAVSAIAGTYTGARDHLDPRDLTLVPGYLCPMKTYFVSGHLDLTVEEFRQHYVPRIQEGIEAGAAFVIGDAVGGDARAQEFLSLAGYARVTVYHMFEAPRHNHGFPTVGGFTSDGARDAALTAASTDDIAWVRPGREKSGTAKNLKRRETRCRQ